VRIDPAAVVHTREQLAELERRFGRPAEAEAAATLAEASFALVEGCARRGRVHDVTLLAMSPAGEFALIRKPGYPEGVFRPPSGGVEPGESIEAGARREAREETGLEVRLERYLLRVEAEFTHAGRVVRWTTHVLSAAVVGGELAPLDRKEIAEARWALPAEIHDRYRPRMLAMGSRGMRYRVDLQDAALTRLGLPPPSAAGPPETDAGYRFRLLEPNRYSSR
jgi:ADP-ribose pyrophosphatase YjhB (NUDIX family)